MLKNDEYKPGNPEYDYWNDKNLYPSLRHDEEPSRSQQVASLDDTKVGIGSVFGTIFVWLFIFAPFALLLTWENWIVQLVFWGGSAVIVLIFVLWLCGTIEEYKEK